MRESRATELELEGGDVPADVAAVQHAAADRVPAVAAEGAAGVWADDAVCLDPDPALEASTAARVAGPLTPSIVPP